MASSEPGPAGADVAIVYLPRSRAIPKKHVTQSASIEDIHDEEFERTFRTNIFGYFLHGACRDSANEARQRDWEYGLDYWIAG